MFLPVPADVYGAAGLNVLHWQSLQLVPLRAVQYFRLLSSFGVTRVQYHDATYCYLCKYTVLPYSQTIIPHFRPTSKAANCKFVREPKYE